MARPTKLTPEVQEKICDAIRHGATYWAAAESAGVAYSSFNNWMQDKRPRYLKFLEAVQRANADAQLDLLAKIQAATKTDWRAASWILERRFKNDFGTAVDLTTGGDAITFIIERSDGTEKEDQAVPETT